MKETHSLVEYCHTIGSQPLPKQVAKHARVLLLDYLGVAAAGSVLEESSHIARQLVRELGGTGEASAFGIEARVPAPLAALVNGTTAHGIEMDDTHARSSSHPGAVIWSTALAVAEREGLTGASLLPAAAAGYEAACRVAAAANPTILYRRGFHPTSTCGVFGAALTAACLLGLSQEETLNSVGIAGSFASGNMEYLAQGTLTKRLQPGNAAHNGIIAALLAGRSYTGPSSILEGKHGFLHAFSSESDKDALTKNLGEKWEISRTGLKLFGCCRYMHSPIEATLRALEFNPVKPDEVTEIRIGLITPGWPIVVEPIEDKYKPKTRVDGQFSLPFGIATALVHGQAMATEFRQKQLSDSTILELARKVTIEHDKALDQQYPERWPSWCKIKMSNGRTLHGTVNTTKGDPDNPLTQLEIQRKFDLLAAQFWSKKQYQQIVDMVASIDRIEVRHLMNMVRLHQSQP